jgi:hypothetical protein
LLLGRRAVQGEPGVKGLLKFRFLLVLAQVPANG